MSSVFMLQERIEGNMEEFRAKMLALDAKTLYESARRIVAVDDVYFYITTHDFISETEAESLLKLDNPLIALADHWEEYLDDVEDAVFDTSLSKLFERDECVDGDDWPDYDGDDDDDWGSNIE